MLLVGHVKYNSHFQKAVWQIFKYLDIKLPYNTVIKLLVVYPGEMKT